MTCVIDASGLLLFLRKQPGAVEVQQHLPGSLISAISFFEVYRQLHQQGATVNRVGALLKNWKVKIIPFDEAQALAAWAIHRHSPELWHEELAALSLARVRRCPLLTASSKVREQTGEVEIKSIPQEGT